MTSEQPENKIVPTSINTETTKSGTKVEPPTPLHKQKIKPDFKKIYTVIGKGSIDIFTGNWGGLGKDIIDLVGAFGLKTDSPESMAGLLIIRGIVNAIQELVNDTAILKELQNTKTIDTKQLTRQVTESLDKYNDLVIDDNFFTHPQNLPFLKDFQNDFYLWLTTAIDNENEARSISNRLAEYFANALLQEWKNNQSQYQIILTDLDNPFTPAVTKQLEWNYYRTGLQKIVQEPVFQEAFSLDEIYLPLRAFYEEKIDKQNDKNDRYLDNNQQQKLPRVVVNPETVLDEWLAKTDKDDAIRMLTGSPGSGKSSFSKMWAAKQARQGKNVLFIPLHRFDFQHGNIVESISKFIVEDNNFFSRNPLEKSNTDLSLLIIFDGLDELAKQGKIGEETARNFVDDIKNLVNYKFNQNKTCLQVVIIGREVVIQANSRRFQYTEKLLYLLPYYLSESEKRKYKYIDKDNLLAEDQRQLWWQKYARLKGKDYTGLPQQLDRDNLIDITSQPLLNYLVVLSYEQGEVKFDENTNLNEIYADLLARVYNRGYEGQNRQHQAIEGLEFEEFRRILMEIAITCWHGNGRRTTVKAITKCCENNNLKHLFNKFVRSLHTDNINKIAGSINNLLWAFYFRQSEDLQGSDKTFEFSHKSFGEYLTAIRIVNGLSMIHNQLKTSEETYGTYDEKQALMDWAKLCGKSPLDFDIFAFICREIELCDIELVKAWQTRLCKLIEYVMAKRMPLEAIGLVSFQEMLIYSKNSESALLIVLNACAKYINRELEDEDDEVYLEVHVHLSVIDWKSPTNFGEWISFLIGQRQDWNKLLITDCLSYLSLEKCDLRLKDFYRANLTEADLTEADLRGANLTEANLTEANLTEANLTEANLRGAHLSEANLKRADLIGTDLRGAYLRGAHLTEIDLTGADLTGSDLTKSDLKEAYSIGAYLEGTILEGTILEENDLFT